MPKTPRSLKERIRVVARALRSDWDPIGAGQIADLPAHEYESYAPVVVGMFERGESDEAVARHLQELELRIGGPPARPLAKLLDVARAVRAAT